MVLKQVQRKKGELNLPLVYLAVVGAAFFLAYIFYLLNRLPHLPCVFKNITGYPCPTCGTTRLAEALMHIDIASAFLFNPLAFLCGTALIAWGGYGFYMQLSRKKFKVILTKTENLFLRLGLGIIFILNWIYLVSCKI